MNQLWIKRILGDKLFFDHKYTPAKVIPHPHYWVEPRENDIALIKLSGPMVLGYDVPSRMQLSQSEPEGRLLFSGWGSKKVPNNRTKSNKPVSLLIVYIKYFRNMAITRKWKIWLK